MKTTIASPDNKFYKILRKLDKKKYRDKNNIFKAEGEKFLKEKINFTKIIIKESKYEYLENKYKQLIYGLYETNCTISFFILHCKYDKCPKSFFRKV